MRDCIVYVVDGDLRTRSAALHALGAADLPAQSYSRGAAFLASIDRKVPACAVIESTLPDMQGLDVIRTLRRRRIALPAVLLSSAPSVADAVEAFRSGAVDFVEKPIPGRRLVTVVRSVLDRHAYRPLRSTPRPDLAVVRGRLAQLSTREREVLGMVMLGKSSREIAAAIKRAPKTVEYHRRNIMQKMSAGNTAELVRYATLATEVCSR